MHARAPRASVPGLSRCVVVLIVVPLVVARAYMASVGARSGHRAQLFVIFIIFILICTVSANMGRINRVRVIKNSTYRTERRAKRIKGLTRRGSREYCTRRALTGPIRGSDPPRHRLTT